PLNLWGFVSGSFLLDHLTAAFEYRTLLNHQRRSRDVTVELRRAARFNSLAGDDVSVDDAMNGRHRNFDIRIDLAAGADNQCAGCRSDAARETTVYAKHRFE